jgi:hypothetical protein
MEHNQGDVIKAKHMARELNMQIVFKLSWGPGLRFENPEVLKRETGLEALSREDYIRENKRPYYFSVCTTLWNSPVINWDGKLLGCNRAGGEVPVDFGVNVFKSGLKKALKTKNVVLAKKMLLGEATAPVPSRNIPCTSCDKYKIFVEYNSFFTEAEIKG